MAGKLPETVFKNGKRMSAAEYMRTEFEDIQNEARHFLNYISNLETELSSLLHAIINGKKSKVAHAIFFSVNSLDARVTIVENALLEAISENGRLTHRSES